MVKFSGQHFQVDNRTMKTMPKKLILKILLTSTVISVVVFSLVCLASYVVTKESVYNYSVGFPYKFFQQFRLSNSDSNNWGWTPYNFFIDALLIWTISLIGYLLWLKIFSSYNKKWKFSR